MRIPLSISFSHSPLPLRPFSLSLSLSPFISTIIMVMTAFKVEKSQRANTHPESFVSFQRYLGLSLFQLLNFTFEHHISKRAFAIKLARREAGLTFKWQKTNDCLGVICPQRLSSGFTFSCTGLRSWHSGVHSLGIAQPANADNRFNPSSTSLAKNNAVVKCQKGNIFLGLF